MTDTHVIPVNDLMPHRETRACWCCPRVEVVSDIEPSSFLSRVEGWAPEDADCLVTHNALDMRELREKA